MSNTSTITLSRGLVELKTIEDRIIKASEAQFTSNFVNGKTHDTQQEVLDFSSKAISNFQKLSDLIVRRNKVKNAVVSANATTMVNVAGVEMTIANAIEQKSFLSTRKNTLLRIKMNYNKTVHNHKELDESFQTRKDQLQQKAVGSDQSEVTKALLKELEDTQTPTIFDPCDIKSKIEDMEKEIQDFEDDVDVALSIVNATTTITIE